MHYLTVGFIGFGEAAFNIAKGLKEERIGNIIAFDKYAYENQYSELIMGRAAQAGVTMKREIGQLIKDSNIIFCAVSADMVIPLAKEVREYLSPKQIYVDINSASPNSKKIAGEIISDSGALFVDGAVMASVAMFSHKVPILISGPGAKKFKEIMQKYNMNLNYRGEKAGDSSAIKMFRSIFMKGIVMLLLETIVASHEYGVEDDVWATILETLTNSSAKRIEGWITRGVINSKRREHEMEEVLSLLEELDTNSIMSLATRDKLRWCSNIGFKEYFNGVPPEAYHEILKAIDIISDDKLDAKERTI